MTDAKQAAPKLSIRITMSDDGLFIIQGRNLDGQAVSDQTVVEGSPQEASLRVDWWMECAQVARFPDRASFLHPAMKRAQASPAMPNVELPSPPDFFGIDYGREDATHLTGIVNSGDVNEGSA